MAFWNGLASAVGSLFGSAAGKWLGNQIDMSSAKELADYQAKLQRENWQFQQSNAHQFEVGDLRKAGLNPILSATNSQMAGMSSVSTPFSSSGDLSTSISTGKQLAINKKQMEYEYEIAGKKISIDEMNSATELLRAQNEKALIASQIGVNNATVGKIAEEENFIRTQKENAIKRLPYEIDKLAADTEAQRAAARLAISQIGLVVAQEGLTKAQEDSIRADLNDPKKLGEKSFWNKVFNSDEQHYKTIRNSLYRGMENDILFSFGSPNNSGGTDLESILNILARGKYLGSKPK